MPKPNPRYNPRAAAQVGGWMAAGTCSLATKDGVLVVTSTGGDPYFHTSAVPATGGPVVFKVRMRCKTAGPAQVFWTTAKAGRFHRSRSAGFKIRHDGQWHDYEAKLPAAGRLTGLRLDPGTAAGKVEIDWISLGKSDGAKLKRWDWATGKSPEPGRGGRQ